MYTTVAVVYTGAHETERAGINSEAGSGRLGARRARPRPHRPAPLRPREDPAAASSSSRRSCSAAGSSPIDVAAWRSVPIAEATTVANLPEYRSVILEHLHNAVDEPDASGTPGTVSAAGTGSVTFAGTGVATYRTVDPPRRTAHAYRLPKPTGGRFPDSFYRRGRRSLRDGCDVGETTPGGRSPPPTRCRPRRSPDGYERSQTPRAARPGRREREDRLMPGSVYRRNGTWTVHLSWRKGDRQQQTKKRRVPHQEKKPKPPSSSLPPAGCKAAGTSRPGDARSATT